MKLEKYWRSLIGWKKLYFIIKPHLLTITIIFQTFDMELSLSEVHFIDVAKKKTDFDDRIGKGVGNLQL